MQFTDSYISLKKPIFLKRETRPASAARQKYAAVPTFDEDVNHQFELSDAVQNSTRGVPESLSSYENAIWYMTPRVQFWTFHVVSIG
jgi:hypothetical protein